MLTNSQKSAQLDSRITTPYLYKKPLNDDELDSVTNACDTVWEKPVVWTLFSYGFRIF
jgi:hypothetical protein